MFGTIMIGAVCFAAGYLAAKGRLAGTLRKLEEAVIEARDRFLDYADQHEAKVPALEADPATPKGKIKETLAKAESNRLIAARIGEALPPRKDG